MPPRTPQQRRAPPSPILTPATASADIRLPGGPFSTPRPDASHENTTARTRRLQAPSALMFGSSPVTTATSSVLASTGLSLARGLPPSPSPYLLRGTDTPEGDYFSVSRSMPGSNPHSPLSPLMRQNGGAQDLSAVDAFLIPARRRSSNGSVSTASSPPSSPPSEAAHTAMLSYAGEPPTSSYAGDPTTSGYAGDPSSSDASGPTALSSTTPTTPPGTADLDLSMTTTTTTTTTSDTGTGSATPGTATPASRILRSSASNYSSVSFSPASVRSSSIDVDVGVAFRTTSPRRTKRGSGGSTQSSRLSQPSVIRSNTGRGVVFMPRPTEAPAPVSSHRPASFAGTSSPLSIAETTTATSGRTRSSMPMSQRGSVSRASSSLAGVLAQAQTHSRTPIPDTLLPASPIESTTPAPPASSWLRRRGSAKSLSATNTSTSNSGTSEPALPSISAASAPGSPTPGPAADVPVPPRRKDSLGSLRTRLMPPLLTAPEAVVTTTSVSTSLGGLHTQSDTLAHMDRQHAVLPPVPRHGPQASLSHGQSQVATPRTPHLTQPVVHEPRLDPPDAAVAPVVVATADAESGTPRLLRGEPPVVKQPLPSPTGAVGAQFTDAEAAPGIGGGAAASGARLEVGTSALGTAANADPGAGRATVIPETKAATGTETEAVAFASLPATQRTPQPRYRAKPRPIADHTPHLSTPMSTTPERRDDAAGHHPHRDPHVATTTSPTFTRRGSTTTTPQHPALSSSPLPKHSGAMSLMHARVGPGRNCGAQSVAHSQPALQAFTADNDRSGASGSNSTSKSFSPSRAGVRARNLKKPEPAAWDAHSDSDGETELHEVDDRDAKAATPGVAERYHIRSSSGGDSSSSAVRINDTRNGTTSELLADLLTTSGADAAEHEVYIPPYAVRRNGKSATVTNHQPRTNGKATVPPTIADSNSTPTPTPTSDDSFTLTLAASLASSLPLPFDRRRVELIITWSSPRGLWAYVPFAKWWPAWNVIVGGTHARVLTNGESGEVVQRAFEVRAMVRDLLGCIPVVGRFSVWL